MKNRKVKGYQPYTEADEDYYPKTEYSKEWNDYPELADNEQENSYMETPDQNQPNNYSSEHDPQERVTRHQSPNSEQLNNYSSEYHAQAESSNFSLPVCPSGMNSFTPAFPPSYPQPLPRYLDSKKLSGTVSQPNTCNITQSSSVPATASSIYPQPMPRSLDSKKPNGTVSQPNMYPSQQLHESNTQLDKKMHTAQQPLTHHTELSTEIMNKKNNLSQPISRQYQSREDNRSTNRSLFQATNVGKSHLKIEDIYIEAMTLAAEIRIHRRQLDERGREELSKILKFCHNALHEKLVISSKRPHETENRTSTPKNFKL